MTKSIKEHSASLTYLMKLIDSVIIIGTGVASFFILEPIKHFMPYTGFMPESYLTIIILGFMFSAWWFPAFNVYQSWRWASLFSEMRGLLIGWTFATIGLLTFIFFTKTATEFSRHWFIVWFVSVYVVLLLQRFILRRILHILRHRGVNLRHIVIVGDGLLTEELIEKIQQAKWMGLNIKGIFADMPINNITTLPHLGKTQDVLNYVESNAIDQVWITLPLKAMEKIENLCRQLHSVVVEVKLVPDIASLRLLNYSVMQLDGIAVINMSISPMSSGHRLFKWLEDKIISFIILLIISPLLAIIALAVKFSSSGPILYKQERVGNNGSKFQMLKFRSMPVDADKEIVWGSAQEKKKTKIGQFLRKTSLDELPQFFNVLKGDMSIVGPRPERTVFVEQFKHEINSYMQKHLVQAGITGWAQINGWRGDTSLKTRLEYDLFYIENWSIWFDLKIICMTLYKGSNSNE